MHLSLMMLNMSRNYCKSLLVPLTEISGFDPKGFFVVPDEVYDLYHKTAAKGAEYEKEWNELFKKYSAQYEKEASEIIRLEEKKLPEGWQTVLPTYSPYTSQMYVVLILQQRCSCCNPKIVRDRYQ